MTAQAAIQTRARHIGVEKLACDGQRVIERQQQHPAQLDRHGFLCRGQRRRQLMRRVRAILKAGPPPTGITGVQRHPIAHRKSRRRLGAGRNLRPDRLGRRRTLVQRKHHRVALTVARASSPAMIGGRLVTIANAILKTGLPWQQIPLM